MRLIPKRRQRVEPEERATVDTVISLADYWAGYLQQMSYQGLTYSMPGARQEDITGAFVGLSQQALKSDGVVFSCMRARQQLFAEARFKYRRLSPTGPGDLFGTQDLEPLERPWPGGTTADLLSRMIQDADLAGNAYFVARPGGVRRLRPDWVKIAVGSMDDPDVALWDVDADVIGYIYQPGGPGSTRDIEVYSASEVAHFAPVPDPEAQFRGMSWLTPVVREVMADKAATQHKLAFFENGATPNLVVKIDTPDIDDYNTYVELFKRGHEGAANAYKTIFLAQGADATVVGSDLQQLDFKVVQGAGETRIAAAAGVPPIVVGLSEGLASATYSNYSQARRHFADATMSFLWRNAAASMAPLVAAQQGAELWYDTRDIPFLREDEKDTAEIQGMESATIRQLVDGGFTPESVIAAVRNQDWTLLKHTGLYSVQLQLPGVGVPAGNGSQPPARDVDPVVLRELLAATPKPEA